MKILKTVQVKQILTEASKAKLRDKFVNEQNQIELECQQLRFEQKKMKNQHHHATHQVTQQFQKEMQKREEKLQLIQFKLDQLDKLAIGSEIIEGEVHSIQEVSVGDNWNDMLKEQSIVIKDDIIVKIEHK